MFTSLEGNIFSVHYRAEGEADNGVANITFKVPTMANNGKQIHLYAVGSVSGADFAGGLLEVIENPTITTGSGTEKTVQNLNREASRSNEKSIVTDEDGVSNAVSTDAAIADGTVIYAEDIGHGNTADTLVNLGIPIVLTRNQDYSVRMTSDTADTTSSITLIWQELHQC